MMEWITLWINLSKSQIDTVKSILTDSLRLEPDIYEKLSDVPSKYLSSVAEKWVLDDKEILGILSEIEKYENSNDTHVY